MVGTAQQAANEFPGRITVVDSLSLSLGLGFQVLAAAEAAEEGLESALVAIRSTHRRLHVFAVLDTLEYVRRSGRVPAAITILGSLLSIKPVIELREGVVRPLDAPRTSSKGAQKLFSLLVELGPLEQLSILHTNAELRAGEFLLRLRAEHAAFLPGDIRIINVTPVIGNHVGPNGLGFAAVKIKP